MSPLTVRGSVAEVECDALVVGSGAGGSVAALELARAGRAVTVLEEGPRVSTDELAAASPPSRCAGCTATPARPPCSARRPSPTARPVP
ncbi:FAD-binding protein [Streptomyces diastatochromogenes]|nr:FAD-binding protein [Streptomyces diastatochromogenes]